MMTPVKLISSKGVCVGVGVGVIGDVACVNAGVPVAVPAAGVLVPATASGAIATVVAAASGAR